MFQTFAARTATTSSVFFERLDFFFDFSQLLFDLLSIRSGIKIVVYITLRFSSISTTSVLWRPLSLQWPSPKKRTVELAEIHSSCSIVRVSRLQ